MAVRITCINKSGGNHENPHEAISRLGWTNELSNKSGISTREQMWEWIANQHGAAFVKDAYGNVTHVRALTNQHGTKYLQTYADNTPTDNLLKLPECR